MSRFYGKVGFVESVNKTGGVYEDTATERNYYGDVLQNNRRWDNSQQIIDNVSVTNRISIVSDDFANVHCSKIRYVFFNGERWAITNVEVQRPRLILSLGGVYNGPTPGTSIDS